MDVAAKTGRNPASKHQIQPEYGKWAWWRGTGQRNGTAEPVSRDQIRRREQGQRNITFPCSADHVQDWQPYPVDPCSCYMCDHTYIVLFLQQSCVYTWNFNIVFYFVFCVIRKPFFLSMPYIYYDIALHIFKPSFLSMLYIYYDITSHIFFLCLGSAPKTSACAAQARSPAPRPRRDGGARQQQL